MATDPPFINWTRANQIAWYNIDNLPSLRLGTGNSLTADIINVTTLNATSIINFNDITYNVRSNGSAIGNGLSDDSLPFINGFKAWRQSIRSNLAPNSDGNKIGTLLLEVPAGSYLQKQPQTLLDQNKLVRTKGLEWRGTAGGGQCQILYQPTTAGFMIYNNDEVDWLKLTNLWFNANSATSSGIFSTSSGGAARCELTDCLINGKWQYFIQFGGVNDNSEYTFNFCQIGGDFTAGAFIYSQTSDQFLNYWFNQCTISNLTGIFLNYPMGGHIKINECDFSGYAAEVNNTLLYNLTNGSHAFGVCTFVDHGSRYEVGPHLQVMYSEWASGIIEFDACDYTSQAFQAWATTVTTHQFVFGINQGPAISFRNSSFIGFHSYSSSGSGYWGKKIPSYDNCTSEAFEDFFAMFNITVSAGSALIPIRIRNCRGKQLNWTATYPSWLASHSYIAGSTVSAGIWVYTTTAGGTSGTTQPFGPGTVSDGLIADWVCQNKHQSVSYLNDCTYNSNVAIGSPTEKFIGYFRGVDGRWVNRVNASVPNAADLVLPPNAVLTRIVLHAPSGNGGQASPGSYIVKTNEASPTTFLSFTTTGNLSDGFDYEWNGNFNVGTGLARSIIMQSGLDVTTSPTYPAIAYLEYLA